MHRAMRAGRMNACCSLDVVCSLQLLYVACFMLHRCHVHWTHCAIRCQHCLGTRTHARTHARTHTQVTEHMRAHARTHAHVYTHVRTHTHIHIHTRAHAHSLETYLFDLGPSFVPLIMPRSQRLALSRLRTDY